MEEIITTLSERLTKLLERNEEISGKRILVAFAGSPGSGKTTISAALTEAFNVRQNVNVTVLPMVRLNPLFSRISSLTNFIW